MRMPLPIERRGFVPEVKGINEDSREVTHIISNASVDRAGDIVEPTGWVLDNYLKNPVVLVDHDYRVEKIVGRATSVTISEEGLYATTQFNKEGLGAEVFNLVKAGFARGFSVGFTPIEFEERKDKKGVFKGFHFKKQALHEYSVVAVPMNQDIVTDCLKDGLVSKAHVPILFRADATPSSDALSGAKAEQVVRDTNRLTEATDGLERFLREQRLADALRNLEHNDE